MIPRGKSTRDRIRAQAEPDAFVSLEGVSRPMRPLLLAGSLCCATCQQGGAGAVRALPGSQRPGQHRNEFRAPGGIAQVPPVARVREQLPSAQDDEIGDDGERRRKKTDLLKALEGMR